MTYVGVGARTLEREQRLVYVGGLARAARLKTKNGGTMLDLVLGYQKGSNASSMSAGGGVMDRSSALGLLAA
jgi:hypothetical protein